ncbi:HalOD1 output domain-containing protein [Halobacteriales archaeon Cl-PHB]
MAGDPDVVHRKLDTARENPAAELSEFVAELEGAEAADLQPVWERIGDLLSNVFTTPPTAAAQVQVQFSYEGYRITVEQDGRAKFVKIA